MQRHLIGMFALAMIAGVSVAEAAAMAGQGTWETTLQARDLDQNGSTDAFYDTELNLTWLGNARVTAEGDWQSANNWATDLTFGGYNDWRLPGVVAVDNVALQQVFSTNGTTDYGYAKTGEGWGKASELGFLFYVTLGNAGYCTPNNDSPSNCVGPQTGWAFEQNTGDFQNLRSGMYWTGAETSPGSASVWTFFIRDGEQGFNCKCLSGGAFAVRTGDVMAVPEPQTYATLLAGLVAVGAVVRRRRAKFLRPC